MAEFPTTRISLVGAAVGSSSTESRDALAELCRIYWKPLHLYVCRQGYSAEDARDLTQGFIARMIEKDVLRSFRSQRGRFRSFLLASLKHFLINERDAARALKRGGGVALIPIEDAPEPHDDLTPEHQFERQWALGLLARVTSRLRQESASSGKGEQFHLLKDCLTGDSAPYAELGRELGLSEGAVKAAVHRLKIRYHDVLREEIALTVAHPDDIGDEIRHLFTAVRS
jgi:DNA-directed RNA polymerase specialized sigma24 family protein